MKTFWIASTVVVLALLIGLKARSNGGKPTMAASTRGPEGGIPHAPTAALSPAASRLLAKVAPQPTLSPGPRIAGPGMPAHEASPGGGPMTHIMFQQLEGIMTMSDVIHDNPGLDDEALLEIAGERTGLSKEILRSILDEYPKSETGSLAEHYRRAMANPELKAVADAFDRAGIPRDPGSTLLADGFRLCSLRTLYGDFLSSMWEDLRKTPEGVEPAPELLDEAARVADERSDALVAIESTFKDRFISRHGIEPAAVQALLGALWPLKVTTATAEELHPPRIVHR